MCARVALHACSCVDMFVCTGGGVVVGISQEQLHTADNFLSHNTCALDDTATLTSVCPASGCPLHGQGLHRGQCPVSPAGAGVGQATGRVTQLDTLQPGATAGWSGRGQGECPMGLGTQQLDSGQADLHPVHGHTGPRGIGEGRVGPLGCTWRCGCSNLSSFWAWNAVGLHAPLAG